MDDRHIGVFELGQYVAEELSDAQRQRVASHLERCESCRAQLSQIEADVSAYSALAEEGYAAAWQAARATAPEAETETEPKRAAPRQAPRRWRWPTLLKVVVPAAAAAIIAIVLIPRLFAPPAPSTDPRAGSGYVAYKGTLALQVIAKRAGRQFVVATDARMCPGDALRFSVTAAWSKAHVAVFSFDGAGALSTFYPNAKMASSSGKTVALAGHGRHVLPGSIVLDQTLGREVIVLLASEGPFDPQPIMARVKQLLSRDRGAAATLTAAKVGFSGVLRALVVVKATCS